MTVPLPRTSREREVPGLRPELVASWGEIALVLAVMLGPFAWSSTAFALSRHSTDFVSQMMSTGKLVHLCATQGALLAVFLLYLRWRGWQAADFNIRINWQGTLAAPLVLIFASLANILTGVTLKVAVAWMAPHPHGMLAAVLAGSPHIAPGAIHLSWIAILMGSTINAYLEELVFVGYAFRQFMARRGVLFALLMMAFLRMLLHTYKGPLEMLGIGAFSMVYGLAYVYLRRLWPLILARNLTDIAAFCALKLMFGA